MMDEPSLGLAPLIVGMIFDIIRQINSTGVTVLLVEQNAKAALDVADTGYVMETGTISFSAAARNYWRMIGCARPIWARLSGMGGHCVTT